MTDHEYRGQLVVSALLEDRGSRFPDHVAVSSVDGDLTYEQLNSRAASVAGALAQLGLKPDDRVATMLDPGLDYLAAWFGSAWMGAVEVPVNTEFKGPFLEHILASSGAKALVIHQRWLSRLEGLHLPALRKILVVGEGSFESPLGGATVEPFAGALTESPIARVSRREDDLVYIMYTSGTTGPSKGVMQANRTALVANVLPWVRLLDLTHEDVAFSMFPLFHVTARNAVVSSAFWAGARVEIRAGLSLRTFWDDVRGAKATYFGYMGALIHLLYAQEPRSDDADNPLRVGFGAAAPPEIMEKFERRFGLDLVEVYGSTELGLASASPPGRRQPGTNGRPAEHHTIEIHDEEDRALPTGQPGEICTRPALPLALFSGYWQMPEESLLAFRNLWFHTGDRGLLTESGDLVFKDRIKDSIRRRGENISSFEVERAVQSHPRVLECAAYAVPSPLTEDDVMIAVVARPGLTVEALELFEFCVEALPRFAVPRYIRFVSELPKTPSQRIQKFVLRSAGVTPDAFDREVLGLVIPRE